jgi:hypothetical protein
MMNVLSVDFDYFIRYNTETEALMDSSLEFNDQLCQIIWSDRALTCMLQKRNIEDIIKIDQNELNKMKDIICNSKTKYNFIFNSHAYCYSAIIYMKKLKRERYKDINIYNVDFHHDEFKNGKDLNCGNWLALLKNKGVTNTYWVNKEDSLLKGNTSKILKLDDLNNINFDMIVMCRSDSWVPPHLDTYFHYLTCYLNSIYYEEPLQNRNTQEIRDKIKLMYNQIMEHKM